MLQDGSTPVGGSARPAHFGGGGGRACNNWVMRLFGVSPGRPQRSAPHADSLTSSLFVRMCGSFRGSTCRTSCELHSSGVVAPRAGRGELAGSYFTVSPRLMAVIVVLCFWSQHVRQRCVAVFSGTSPLRPSARQQWPMWGEMWERCVCHCVLCGEGQKVCL